MPAPSAAGVIPARYATTRFPGKPLAQIAGLPMLQRVFERTREAKRLEAVFVATDDERIAEACTRFGAPVLMTRPDHPSGTDRVAEAARSLEHDVIVNVQGDEPLIEGFVIDAAVETLLEDDQTPMSTVVHALDADALDDPNRIKVVLDRAGYALHFSRNPIAYERGAARVTWQHVGRRGRGTRAAACSRARLPDPRRGDRGLAQPASRHAGRRRTRGGAAGVIEKSMRRASASTESTTPTREAGPSGAGVGTL